MPERAPVARLLLRPAGLLGCDFDHAPHARDIEHIRIGTFALGRRAQIDLARLAQNVEQILDAIPPGGRRQFIGEGLHGEGVWNIGHRSHPANANLRVRRPAFGAEVGNIVGNIVPSHVQLECSILRRDIVLRSDGRKHAALQPGRGTALFIRRRLHVHGRHGMIKVEANIVLAAPYHLHGLAQLLGEDGRFGDIIRF